MGVQKLLPEVQAMALRETLHPVPYPGFLFGRGQNFGAAWFRNREERKKYEVVGFLSEQTDRAGSKKIQIRGQLLAQCRRWDRASCPPQQKILVPPGLYAKNTAKNTTSLAFIAYRDAHFSLQPPGITAARKGIVDSLLAGSIPLLFTHLHGNLTGDHVSSLDQGNLWPWHWPWQPASSLTLEPTTDLRSLLAVPPDQRRLMRDVIRRYGADLAWPYVDDDDHQENGGPRALAITLHHLAGIAGRT